MKIAVVGCAHGQLENIYNTLEYLEKENNIRIDLLLCCGDFQATRNLDDLKCMAAPPQFQDICTFYKYYSGEKLAPVLTLFIGGNHEASNHLQELPFGGWVAPNIYYLGYAGVVNIAGIRIAGLSGIFKGSDYCRGRYEKPPYNADTLRSCYHYRNLDIFRLKQLSQPIRIMLSHDWPAGIYNHGNLKQLLKMKPFFKDDIRTDSLGSQPVSDLLNHMKPDYWFAAHLHVKFAAIVEHPDDSTKKTKFLALDKCLPKRKFLQVLDVPHNPEEELELKYDLEWLTVLYLTNSLASFKKLNCYLPSPNGEERWNFTPTEEEMEVVRKKFKENFVIPNNFVATVAAYNPSEPQPLESSLAPKVNPQTVEFCEKLGVDDPMMFLMNEDSFNNSNTSLHATSFNSNSFVYPTDSESDLSSSFRGISPMIRGRDNLKTPLRLPKPLNTSDISNECCWTSTPYKREKLSDSASVDEAEKDESASIETSGVADDSGLSTSSGPKKFIRRNLALYASNDSDV